MRFIQRPTVMPRPRIDLDLYRDEIYYHIFEDDAIINNIILFLRDEKQVNCYGIVRIISSSLIRNIMDNELTYNVMNQNVA